jgi:hypothetical protein
MNWGTKITIIYLAFVGFILVLVFKCFGNESELEYKDYYAREIKFQDQIDASKNAEALSAPIEYIVANKHIEIVVPAELAGKNSIGSVELFRPSNSKLDRMFTLKTDENGHQVITDPSLSTGVYKLSLHITSGNKAYYKEGIITLK